MVKINQPNISMSRESVEENFMSIQGPQQPSKQSISGSGPTFNPRINHGRHQGNTYSMSQTSLAADLKELGLPASESGEFKAPGTV